MPFDAPQPFPCPYCQGSRVHRLGGGRVFETHRCADCAEVWTVHVPAKLGAARVTQVERPVIHH